MDRVVVRAGICRKRDMYIAVLKGTPSAKADSNGSNPHYGNMGLALADIYVGKGVTKDTDAEHHRPAV